MTERIKEMHKTTKKKTKINNTGRSPVDRRPTGVAHSKIARVASVVFVLYVVGRAY